MTQIFNTRSAVPDGLVLDRLADILSAGGLVVVPTDTVYGLVGKAFEPEVFARLDEVKGRRSKPYAVAFASVPHLLKWYGEPDSFRMRVVRSLLPGPVTLLLPERPCIPTGFRMEGEGVAVRVSSDRCLTALIERMGQPVWATSANRSGEPEPSDYQDISPELVGEVNAILNTGATKYRDASTIVDLRRFPFEVTREGPWMNRVRAALQSGLEPLRVLVVCTGNICRSPLLAAALARQLGDPDRSGVVVSSAGTQADFGLPATPDMVLAAREYGLDLTMHRSRPVSRGLLMESDVILAAEVDHIRYMGSVAPESAGKMRLAGLPLGVETIPDPYGADVVAYRETARLLMKSAEEWSKVLRRMVDEAGWKPSGSPGAPTSVEV